MIAEEHLRDPENPSLKGSAECDAASLYSTERIRGRERNVNI